MVDPAAGPDAAAKPVPGVANSRIAASVAEAMLIAVSDRELKYEGPILRVISAPPQAAAIRNRQQNGAVVRAPGDSASDWRQP
jgi:hypothetical protein